MKMDENVKVLKSNIKEWMLGNCRGYKKELIDDVIKKSNREACT
jgi:hypothetical protein